MKTALTTMAFGKESIYKSQTNLLTQSKEYFTEASFFNKNTIDDIALSVWSN